MEGRNGRGVLRLSRRTSLLALIAIAFPAAAEVSWRLSGDALSGPKDYREGSLAGGLEVRPDEETLPVDKIRLLLGRSSYGLKTSTDTTVTWTLGGGLDFRNGMSADLSLWTTPAAGPLRDGSYRAWGGDLGLGARWPGLLPFTDAPHPRFLGTEVSFTAGGATQEEYFIVPIGARTVRRWVPIGQKYIGAGLTERFWENTWVGVDVRSYSYDKDLRALSKKLDFLSLSTIGAANAYDLIQGFPERVDSLVLGQNLWSWGDVSMTWKRTKYVIGRTPESRTRALSVGVFPFKHVGVRARYEVSKAEGFDADVYKGFGVEAGF